MINAPYLSPRTSSDSMLAITHVTVLPMDREVILPDQTVIIRGSTIFSIGPTKKIDVPKGAKIIEGKGKFLIPGLIDMDVRLESVHDFPLFLANGVTTVFNTQGQPGILNWRNRIQKGELSGPNILTSGPRIFQSRTPFDALQTIEAQAKAGYDAIFVTNGVSGKSYPSLISAAKKNHLLVFGHIPRSVSLSQVYEARMPIVHSEEIFNSAFLGVQDVGPSINKAAQLASSSKLPLIAAFVRTTHKVRQAEDLRSFLQRTQIQYLSPWKRESWLPGNNDIQARYAGKSFQAGLQVGMENEKQLIRQWHAFGAPILVGTNANSTGMVPGYCLTEEIKNLSRLGFSNFQALRAATVDSAKALNQFSRVGSLQAGKAADMVLLNANPMIDLANLDKRSGVILRGKWLPSQILQQELTAIPKRYEQLVASGAKAILNGPAALSAFQSSNDPQNLMGQLLMIELVKVGGEPAFTKYVSQMAFREPKNPQYTENGVNTFGYLLLNTKNRPDLAVKVFTSNVNRHPKSANMYDSLAEGYLKSGNKSKAIQLYRQALKVDPTFNNSELALRKLGVSK